MSAKAQEWAMSVTKMSIKGIVWLKFVRNYDLSKSFNAFENIYPVLEGN